MLQSPLTPHEPFGTHPPLKLQYPLSQAPAGWLSEHGNCVQPASRQTKSSWQTPAITPVHCCAMQAPPEQVSPSAQQPLGLSDAQAHCSSGSQKPRTHPSPAPHHPDGVVSEQARSLGTQ